MVIFYYYAGCGKNHTPLPIPANDNIIYGLGTILFRLDAIMFLLATAIFRLGTITSRLDNIAFVSKTLF